MDSIKNLFEKILMNLFKGSDDKSSKSQSTSIDEKIEDLDFYYPFFKRASNNLSDIKYLSRTINRTPQVFSGKLVNEIIEYMHLVPFWNKYNIVTYQTIDIDFKLNQFFEHIKSEPFKQSFSKAYKKNDIFNYANKLNHALIAIQNYVPRSFFEDYFGVIVSEHKKIEKILQKGATTCETYNINHYFLAEEYEQLKTSIKTISEAVEYLKTIDTLLNIAPTTKNIPELNSLLAKYKININNHVLATNFHLCLSNISYKPPESQLFIEDEDFIFTKLFTHIVNNLNENEEIEIFNKSPDLRQIIIKYFLNDKIFEKFILESSEITNDDIIYLANLTINAISEAISETIFSTVSYFNYSFANDIKNNIGNTTTYGRYYPSISKIEFNKKAYFDLKNKINSSKLAAKIITTFIHECGHGLDFILLNLFPIKDVNRKDHKIRNSKLSSFDEYTSNTDVNQCFLQLAGLLSPTLAVYLNNPTNYDDSLERIVDIVNFIRYYETPNEIVTRNSTKIILEYFLSTLATEFKNIGEDKKSDVCNNLLNKSDEIANTFLSVEELDISSLIADSLDDLHHFYNVQNLALLCYDYSKSPISKEDAIKINSTAKTLFVSYINNLPKNEAQKLYSTIFSDARLDIISYIRKHILDNKTLSYYSNTQYDLIESCLTPEIIADYYFGLTQLFQLNNANNDELGLICNHIPNSNETFEKAFDLILQSNNLSVILCTFNCANKRLNLAPNDLISLISHIKNIILQNADLDWILVNTFLQRIEKCHKDAIKNDAINKEELAELKLHINDFNKFISSLIQAEKDTNIIAAEKSPN